MAGAQIPFYLNDGSTTSAIYSSTNGSYPTIDHFGWSRDGYNFLYWNTASNGSGTTYYAGDPLNKNLGEAPIYAIWEAVSPSVTYYITSSDELTSIADAIRSKAGTSNLLEFPTGFVDAITNL